MKRRGIIFGGVVAMVASGAASCDSSVAVSSRNISIGNGIVVTLAPDGELFVIQNGNEILGSDPKSPLFSRAIDADNPSGFHPPRSLVNDTFTAIGNDSIAIDNPSPGVVHFSTANDAANTVLISLALAADDGFYGGLGERFEHADARGDIV